VRIVGGIYVNCLCNSDTFYWYMFSLDLPKKPCEPCEEKKTKNSSSYGLIFAQKNHCECMISCNTRESACRSWERVDESY